IPKDWQQQSNQTKQRIQLTGYNRLYPFKTDCKYLETTKFEFKKNKIMAHNLSYNEETAKHSFFSVKEKAWHGLGQIVEDYPTSAGAIRYAGLDYTVEKRPLFTNSLPNELNEM